jgi:hypothetical protein
MFKNNLKIENEKLRQRIEQLEFLMCKGQHNYVTVENCINIHIEQGARRFIKQTCTNCGKETENMYRV